MKYRKIYSLVLAGLVTLTGCGQKTYNDGIYTAKSSPDDHEQYGIVKLTLKDQKIVDCTYESFTKDGKVKSNEYGRHHHHHNNKGYYEKAQLAIKYIPEYPKQLLEKQNLDEVDSITGATIAYDQFIECVENIFEQAQKK